MFFSQNTSRPEAVDQVRMAEELEKAKLAMKTALAANPPTIGLIGVSGTGKSSTINSLFGTDLRVSDVVACTKEFSNNSITASIKEGEIAGCNVSLNVIDAPGLGEDIRLDPDYIAMYREHLNKCDVILWVLAARNRAIALDQMYLSSLSDFHGKMIFGINQVDIVEPMDWKDINLPSESQIRNIDIITRDRKEKIESVLKRSIDIIPFSARRRYNLAELFSHVIESCPAKRRWMFGVLKNFDEYDFIPDKEVRAKVKAIVEKQQNAVQVAHVAEVV